MGMCGLIGGEVLKISCGNRMNSEERAIAINWFSSMVDD